jgi:protein subunit release factor B
MAKYSLKDSDLEIEHVKGSGPGGQNRNKRQTGVRVKHLPTGLIGFATERRTQSDNLRVAMERLEERLRAYFYRPPKRRPTKKTKGSQERRLEGKKHHAIVKKARKAKDWD